MEYDPSWPGMFDQEAQALQGALGEIALRIEHVGSTSVPGLAAKPIVDILVLVRSVWDMSFRPPIESLGYLYQPPLNGEPDNLPFFGKPRPRPRQFHVHVSEVGSDLGASDVAVRDYLRSHPGEAAAYAALKSVVAAQYPQDRLAYIDGKDAYVRDLKVRAVTWAKQAGCYLGLP